MKTRASPSAATLPQSRTARARPSPRARTPRATSRRTVSVQFLHVHLPVGPNRSVLIALRLLAELDERLRHGLDERRRAAHEDARLLRPAEPDLAQQRGVDAPRVARPAVALLARERQDDVVAEQPRARRGRSRRRACARSRRAASGTSLPARRGGASPCSGTTPEPPPTSSSGPPSAGSQAK